MTPIEDDDPVEGERIYEWLGFPDTIDADDDEGDVAGWLEVAGDQVRIVIVDDDGEEEREASLGFPRDLIPDVIRALELAAEA